MNVSEIIALAGKTAEWCKQYNLSDAENIEAVKRNGYALQYVKDQTEQVCIEAVKRNGFALRYVKEQTEQVCIEAVKEDGDALRYVNLSIFSVTILELTVKQVSEKFGCAVKIIE